MVNRDYIVHNDDVIKGFFGPYRWLSNFHVSPVFYRGTMFNSVEAAYQGAKALPDFDAFKKFVELLPKDARREGQKIKLPEDWEDIKYDVMLDCVWSKFQLDEELSQKLWDTGKKYLEETNHWGCTYWGVDIKKGGNNNLGKILMLVRDGLERGSIL